MAVATPCIRACVLRSDSICSGCHRTLDEIAAWAAASEQRKAVIVAAAVQRAGRGQPVGGDGNERPRDAENRSAIA